MKTTETPTYVVHDLTLVSPDRSRKDIKSLKAAVEGAEQTYYPNRVSLYDLYHDVYTIDGFLNGIITKRINNVLNKTLKFTNAKGQVDDDITTLISSKKGRDLITQILESKFWGVSGVEFEVGKEFEFSTIPRKHIKPEKGLITKSQYGFDKDSGFEYHDMPFVWVIGDKNDLGLLLPCSMYAVYKRGNFADWAQYVEIFGQPVRIMKYDAYDTQTKTELNKVLNNSGSSLAMMIPKQADFEMMDGKASNGDGKLQNGFKDACNAEMAICILGNTETTTSSTSSGYAQSKEHGKQQDEITKSDLAFVSNMLNHERFINILKSYGLAVEGGKFEYELELDLVALKTRKEIDEFVATKVPIGDDYWYETYGIPKPENYEALKKEIEAKNEELKANSQQPIANGSKLKETKKQNLIDGFLKNLADFFDQAQP